MPPPKDISELHHFLGMANQLGKVSHRLADLTKPLRELLSVKNSWNWGLGSSQSNWKPIVYASIELLPTQKVITHKWKKRHLLVFGHSQTTYLVKTSL